MFRSLRTPSLFHARMQDHAKERISADSQMHVNCQSKERISADKLIISDQWHMYTRTAESAHANYTCMPCRHTCTNTV